MYLQLNINSVIYNSAALHLVLDATIANSKTRQKYANYESDFTPPAHGIAQFYSNGLRLCVLRVSSNVVAIERLCASDICRLAFGLYKSLFSTARVPALPCHLGFDAAGPSLLSPPYGVECFSGILGGVTLRFSFCFRLVLGSPLIPIWRRNGAKLNRFDFGFAFFVCDVRSNHQWMFEVRF